MEELHPQKREAKDGYFALNRLIAVKDQIITGLGAEGFHTAYFTEVWLSGWEQTYPDGRHVDPVSGVVCF